MCNTCVDIINGYVSGNADAFLFLIFLLLIVVDGEQGQPRESLVLTTGFFLVVKGKMSSLFSG